MPAPTPADEDARLRALHALRILDTPPEGDFDDIVALAATICGAPVSLVSLIDADRQWFKAKIGVDATETAREVSFCAHAIMGRDLMLIPDLAADPRFAGHPAVHREAGVRFYAGAPLVTSDGHALGTLCVIDSRPRRLNVGQLRALRALAQQVTAQLELRRYADVSPVRQDLNRRSDEFAGLVNSGLREPLTVLRDLLRKPPNDLPPDGDGVRAIVRQHGGGLLRLVDDLLGLGPVDAGAAPTLRMRRVDLAYLTECAVEAVRPIGDAKNIPITVYARAPLAVYADPWRLLQSLGHLLFNAVKFTPAGGRVEVMCSDDPLPAVHLRDWAPATAGAAPSLFEHLYLGAIVRQRDLLGPDLGLAVVKAILAAHRATLAITDRPVDGTTLHIVFPAP